MAEQERALDREPAFCRGHLGEREGEYVLVRDEAVAGFFSGHDDALRHGCWRFGLRSFLVKQIGTVERARFMSRGTQPRLASH